MRTSRNKCKGESSSPGSPEIGMGDSCSRGSPNGKGAAMDNETIAEIAFFGQVIAGVMKRPQAVVLPYRLHDPSGDRRRWQVMSRHQRSRTPKAMAKWLVDVARCAKVCTKSPG